MGDRRRASRKRAVGTREHIVAHLAGTQELLDPGGMASTRLAAAVGYPGSSVAFAQLLSGMERSGLIERDVRGKRTYRIGLGPMAAAGADGDADADAADRPAGADADAGGELAGADADEAAGAGAGGELAGFDYDELARRLLGQVVRRLAGTVPGGVGAVGAVGAVSAPATAAPDLAVLRETVAGLEYELADAWTKHGKLAEENVKLRERLRTAEQALALARESLRRLPIAADLDSTEVLVLQRLLAGDTADWEAARSLRA
jgi:hypothetical protein